MPRKEFTRTTYACLFQALTDPASVLIATDSVGITFALHAGVGVGHRSTQSQRIRASNYSETGLGGHPRTRTSGSIGHPPTQQRGKDYVLLFFRRNAMLPSRTLTGGDGSLRCLNRISATCDQRRGTGRNQKREGLELALLRKKNAHSRSRLLVEHIIAREGGGAQRWRIQTLLEVSFLPEAIIG